MGIERDLCPKMEVLLNFILAFHGIFIINNRMVINGKIMGMSQKDPC